MLRICILALVLGSIAAPQSRRTAARDLIDEANAHYRSQRPAEAVRLFREYLAGGPDRPDVRVFLGAALLNLNQPAAALEEARRAIALDPKLGKAYVLAGRVYAGQQEWEIAQELFAKALELDDSDHDAWYFSGRGYYEAGLFEEAIRALLRAGTDSRVHENLGLAYEAAGRASEAEAAYKRAVELSKTGHRPRLAYGVFLFKHGRLREGLPMLREALRLDPNSIDTRFELARALYQAESYSEAVKVLSVPVPPDQCRIHNLRGRILLRMGDAGKAMGEFDAFRSCVRENPEIQR